MKIKILTVLSFLLVSELYAQKELNISQYMISRYTINSAFGGSQEALSIFGSVRQGWQGFEKAPKSVYFSAHTPLKKESIALGLDLFSESVGFIQQSGMSASYTYRIQPKENTWLALGLKGGVSTASPNWGNLSVKESGDPSFSGSESNTTPIMGFGSSWYSKSFFVGFSIPNFFYNNLADIDDAEIDPGKVQYLLTGGYLFKLTDQFKFQPSALVALNGEFGEIYDISGSIIWNDKIWLGGTYRSTNYIVGMIAYQFMPQWRFAYSFDYSTGDLKGYDNGAHEVSLQFTFGYKVITPSPKYF